MTMGFPDPTIGQPRVTDISQLSASTLAQLARAGTGGEAGEETEETFFNGEADLIVEPTFLPPAITPAITPAILEPVQPGSEEAEPMTAAMVDGITAVPVVAPLIAAGAVAAIRALIIRFGGRLSVGVFVLMIKRWGAVAVKLAVGVLAFNELMDLVGLGADPSTIIDIKLKKKRKRYTIGYNPRVQTLQKVARHTMKLLKRHRKYIDEFFPRQKKVYGIPPAKALSAIERKAISG